MAQHMSAVERGPTDNGIEQQFQWAVQALAQPAEIQPQLFPSFVMVPDELALDFDNWRIAFDDRYGHVWSLEQRNAVVALDELLTMMSGPDKPEYWISDGCLNHPVWSEVRRLAAEVLSVFRWPQDRPPPDRALYAQYRARASAEEA